MNIISKIKQHTVAKNAFALVLLQLSNYAIPLLLLPYLTRTLGIDVFGIVAITLAVGQFAFVLTDYGFSLSATYSISTNRHDQDYINNKVTAIFFAKLILFIIAMSVILIIPVIITKYQDYHSYFFVILIAVFFQTFQPIWFFQGIEKMKNITAYTVFTKLIYALLILVFIKAPKDGVYVILFWGISHAIGTFFALYFLYKENYRYKKPSISSIFNELKDGLEFFWSRLAVSIYTSLSTIVVGTSSPLQAGLYAASEQIYKAGQNVTAPINTAMFPYMARNKDWYLFFKLFFISLTVLIIGSLIIAYYATPLLTFLFGEEFAQATPILYTFIITVNISYIAVTFGYSAFSALGRNDIANKSVIYGAVSHIMIISLLFISSNIYALSVAITVLLTEILISAIRIFYFLKIKRTQHD